MKNPFIKNILSREIVRNSSVLLSGNFLGQAIAFAVYPLLTRMYSESDFGIFATYASFYTLLATIGTLRYEESLVIAKDEQETRRLFSFSFGFLICFSLLLLVVFWCFGRSFFAFFRLDDIADFRYYIPVSVIFTGSIFLLTNLAIRRKQYKTIASAGLLQNTVNAGSRVTFGNLALTQIGLIVSNVLSLVAATTLLFPIRKRLFWKDKCIDNLNTALKYKDFPMYNCVRSVINQVSMNLPFLYLIGFFDTDRIGLFSLAFIVLTTPINLVVNSLYSVFFERFSASQKQGVSAMPLVKKYWKAMVIYVLPLFILAFFIARPLFPIVFGSQWLTAGSYFTSMLPWGFLMLFICPFYSAFIVFRKQNIFLVIEILYLLVRFIALFVGVKYGDFRLCVLLFTLAGIIFSCLYITVIGIILRNEINKSRADE
ncbi:MAG: oligosaccharide flippase family protein [Dysgonamonadaceae bacterium]|jgi:O-antigen/teichoic acid export membrane protein|nr:oligosaccharide flippase family protein [Dysgonamonadaceae bacterium]